MISLTPLTNLNSAVPWGLWVSIYVWLVGISAGSFTLVMWGSLRNKSALKKISREGAALALAALLAGLLSIQLDLGRIERFYKLFISPNFASVMALMVWLYGVYSLILALSLRNSAKKEIPKLFLLFGFVFSLAVILMESLLFAIPQGKLWHSPIFSICFLTSSLASGIAALMFIAGALFDREKKSELVKGLSKIALPIIGINLAVEIIYMFSIGHIENWFLLIANISVMAILLKGQSLAITIASGAELLIILLSKYNILISAQVIEPFKGFANAYIEPRLQFHYTPNLFEYLIGIFLIVLAVILFHFLRRVLLLAREE